MTQTTKPGREQGAYEWHTGPKAHAKNRRCEATLSECATAGQIGERGKVSAYALPIKGVLLCEACRRKLLRKDLKPSDLTKVKVLPKPGPKRTGYHVPNLRPIREAAGISRQELADQAECSPRTVEYVELGRHRPSLALINRMALVVGANVRDLRGDETA